MSVLQSQPSLSISTNQCKQKFLTNEIQSMRVTKEIYCGIFDELKALSRRVSNMGQNNNVQKSKGERLNQCDTTNVSHNVSVSTDHQSTSHISTSSLKIKDNKNINSAHELKQINSHIHQITADLQQKVKDYCSSSISQNIVNYLEIEKEEHQFYPQVIHQLNTFIKGNQKQIAHREKQLQQIEDKKYLKNTTQNNNNDKNIKRKSSAQKDRKSTQKTISTFDFNKRVMQVVKKQITTLKLRKRKLLLEIEQKKEINAKKQTKKENSQNLHQLRNINKSQYLTPQTAKSQQHNAKKLSGLKINNNTGFKQNLKKVQNSKNDISAFQKIVMIYQKQKFLNSRIQQQISKLQKKISSQRQQNNSLEQKTAQLQKQIQKLEWSKVCDSSFAPVHHRKIDRPIQLSILDRTFLKPCEQKSIEYSEMSINQSMIKKD